jgi:hypothetical protein
MNINLSAEEIRIVAEALAVHRSMVSMNYSNLLATQDQDSDAVIVANQHRKAIGATLAKIDEETGKHYSSELLEKWSKVSA